MKRPFVSTVVVTIGFILSPLSWWNDLVVNIPLSYLMSWPFTLINETIFLYAFIFAYWLTNLVGLFMMHWGGLDLLKNSGLRFNMKQSLAVSSIYSLVIIILVWQGWLVSPVELMKYIE